MALSRLPFFGTPSLVPLLLLAFCNASGQEGLLIPTPPTLLERLTPIEDEEEESPREYGLGIKWSLVRLSRYEILPGGVVDENLAKRGIYLEVGADRFLIQRKQSGLFRGSLVAGGSLGVFNELERTRQVGSVRLLAMPMELYTAYRMEFVQRQLIVPYMRLAAGTWFYRQTTSLGNVSQGAVPGMSLGAGVDLLLDFTRWDYSRWTDENFGINWTMITGEFNFYNAFDNKQPNFSHWQINLGVRFEM